MIRPEWHQNCILWAWPMPDYPQTKKMEIWGNSAQNTASHVLDRD